MMKKECEIIKDLLPNYIENQINDATKDFVEEHIKTCNDCKEMLEYLNRQKKYHLRY